MQRKRRALVDTDGHGPVAEGWLCRFPYKQFERVLPLSAAGLSSARSGRSGHRSAVRIFDGRAPSEAEMAEVEQTLAEPEPTPEPEQS
jgi:hypothetical protein